jgi:hypothetical protein
LLAKPILFSTTLGGYLNKYVIPRALGGLPANQISFA